jgi:hypothetical protein
MTMAKKKEKFIQKAIKKPGALTAQADRAKKSPMEFAREKEHASGKTGQRARFALMLRGMNKRRKGRQHRR